MELLEEHLDLRTTSTSTTRLLSPVSLRSLPVFHTRTKQNPEFCDVVIFSSYWDRFFLLQRKLTAAYFFPLSSFILLFTSNFINPLFETNLEFLLFLSLQKKKNLSLVFLPNLFFVDSCNDGNAMCKSSCHSARGSYREIMIRGCSNFEQWRLCRKNSTVASCSPLFCPKLLRRCIHRLELNASNDDDHNRSSAAIQQSRAVVFLDHFCLRLRILSPSIDPRTFLIITLYFKIVQLNT